MTKINFTPKTAVMGNFMKTHLGTITNVTSGDDGVTIHSDKSKFGNGKGSGALEFSGKTECAAINKMKEYLLDNKPFRPAAPVNAPTVSAAGERQAIAARRGGATVKAAAAPRKRSAK